MISVADLYRVNPKAPGILRMVTSLQFSPESLLHVGPFDGERGTVSVVTGEVSKGLSLRAFETEEAREVLETRELVPPGYFTERRGFLLTRPGSAFPVRVTPYVPESTLVFVAAMLAPLVLWAEGLASSFEDSGVVLAGGAPTVWEFIFGAKLDWWDASRLVFSRTVNREEPFRLGVVADLTERAIPPMPPSTPVLAMECPFHWAGVTAAKYPMMG